ncbi:MAG TPA: hypothetical protein VKB39_02005 [Candidatus Baltobacteraceae bacterium]|nr:hypothetical protein [Candidatus Baltobacteraceae bacterium]
MRLFASLAAAVLASTLLAATPLSPDDAVAITAMVQNQLHVDDLDASMFQEKPYAVAYWGAGKGHAAGQALLKKGTAGWAIVKMTTGSLKSASALESLGVPASTAQALVKDLEVGKAP